MTFRPLSYPNQFVTELEQTVDYDPFVIPAIADQSQFSEFDWYAVELTPAQFTEVLSTVVAGAELVYPDDNQQVQWNFWKLIMTELCSAVMASFEDNTDCQEALLQLLADLGVGQGGGIDDGGPSEMIRTEDLNLNTDCTEDGKYGVAFEVADMMNTVTEDFLDEVAGYANELALAGELLDAIPVFGGLASLVFDFAEWADDELVSNYASAWDTAVHDTVACAIFEEICTDCVVTLDRLMEAYKTLTGIVPPSGLASWTAWVDWMVAVIAPTDTQLVATIHLGILVAWRFGSTWFGSSYRLLQIATQQAGSLSPPMGCDCDADWMHQWLSGYGTTGLTIEKYLQPPDDCTPTVVDDIIIGCCPGANSNDSARAVVDPDSTTIRRVRVTISYEKTRSPGTTDGSDILIDDVSFALEQYSALGTDTFTLDTGEINEASVDEIKMGGWARTVSCTGDGYFEITSIIIEGDGTDPWL